MTNSTPRPLLVIGGGIAGLTSALEAAEAGREVVLVEREPVIGGRVLRNHHYFPKLCPPACGMEINIGRLKRNPRIRLLVSTEVTSATKENGGWKVTLRQAPKYVTDRCTACDECTPVCPAKVPDARNGGVGEVAAIRLPNPDGAPKRYFIERSACPDGCTKCVEACKYEAIDLDAKVVEETLEVGAVVLATGWHPYPLEKLTELGGHLDNVIANVNMERMAAPAGPTGGKILRPSDGEPPKKVALVQCAGSRDVNHLPYCSAICCLASMKQAGYVLEQLPEAEVTIYYIDRRTPGRNEEMLVKATEMEGVELIKGKVGKIEETSGGSLKLRVENTETGTLTDADADLVVLATGMVSSLEDGKLPFNIKLDDDGFGIDDEAAGVFVTGVARRPEDVAASVRDATGAAAKAAVAAERSA
jgi:quinone-modifying oxidoreductase, subunit QmoA